jgi:hypothetical protein
MRRRLKSLQLPRSPHHQRNPHKFSNHKEHTMSTAASAVTTVESATTPQTPAFNAGDPSTWKPGEYEEFNRSGKIPEAPVKASDSATDTKDKKETAATADSATAKDSKKSADTASGSATDKDQKPNLKTKEDTDRRFREILDENKTLKQRLDALEKPKASETRDTKQASQPPAEEKAPKQLREFLEEWFPKNPGKKYEDGVEAWAAAREEWSTKQTQKRIDQALSGERQRLQAEASAKALADQLEQMKQRYPDFDPEKLDNAAGEIMANEIPLVIKQMVGSSKVFTDLMYVLAGDEKFSELVALCKTDPLEAMRRIAVTESLVKERVSSGKAAAVSADKTRDASGKFVSSETSSETAASETKPRAPKPVSDIGGRGTAPEDQLRTAAAANDFRSFDAGMKARHFKKA